MANHESGVKTRRLLAGAARELINPVIGTRKAGLRLFGDPIHAIESDLTATALVLSDGETTLVLVALDLNLASVKEIQELRAAISDALDIATSQVLVNFSHDHSSPGLPDYMAAVDTPEDLALHVAYKQLLIERAVMSVVRARSSLQPARVGVGWGESNIGIYRREFVDGLDVLGEVPDHPIDSSVGVIRIDDLEGKAIATLFRYSAHAVTVGPRSLVASTDYPGPARDLLESSIGGLAMFLQGCGGNINPAVGIGYEVDCRDTKNRVGWELGGAAVEVAAAIRTNRQKGKRTTFGNIPRLLVTPWEEANTTRTVLASAESTIGLGFASLPSLDEAREMHEHWSMCHRDAVDRNAPEWEIRYAKKYEAWSTRLIDAVIKEDPTCDLVVQAVRINGIVIVGISAETFFETGLEIRRRSSLPDTFVLGYTNGCVMYLPRAADYPAGGWRIEGDYALPDMMPQDCLLPGAFHPESENRAIETALNLIDELSHVEAVPV